ncbi:MAG: aminoglycoside phosphotransferase [Proteobacteria bacterium SG_bin9]|nr:MAG: aminoglycoside phosphotransferase [Proteobacteria bacterium SG_bin9]
MSLGVKRDDEYSGTKEVEERHRVDEARLAAWMAENVEGFKGPLTVSQFKGGQSNPTYRLDTPSRAYVMRRKPFGKLLPSAHAVDREFKVIAALGKQNFPVAKAYALCMDDNVIGAAFYIMSMEEGRVFWEQTLPRCSKDERHAIFTSKIETLAKLHMYEPDKIGLGDFGKPGNYFSRQVDRWTKQYKASETQHIPEMERLIEWLPKTVPPQERVSIVHGDYRLDNMIFHATEPRVQAVLDWELSTLGDPMADFTYLLMQWVMKPGLGDANFAELNIPTQDEAAQIYCKATGRDKVPDLNWYYAYNLFRLAGITQGIAGRIRDGTAANAKAIESAKRTVPLAQSSWAYAQKAGAS